MRTNRIGALLRRTVAATCAFMLCFSLAGLFGCSNSVQGSDQKQGGQTAQETDSRTFIDSLGREVQVPTTITAIAPSGSTAQQVLLTMAPDLMVGMADQPGESQLKYFSQDLASLPIFGAIFGGKGDMNKEALAAAAPQIVIDTGEAKAGHKEDLDNLQAQLGIPVVFISTPLDDYATAYNMLGDLLGMEERGKELADYCEKAYEEVKTTVASIPESDRVNVAYLMGDAGLNAIAKGSYQGAVIDLCANNVVVVEKASGSGFGNEINFEQIAIWDPELIVFGSNSIYDSVGADAAWAGIDAIKNGNYFEVPSEPWIWLNNPPTVNQILGLQWFPRICYPDVFGDDLQDVVTDYYKTFYNYSLSDAEYQELTEYAQPK